MTMLIGKSCFTLQGMSKILCEFAGKNPKKLEAFGTEREWRKGMGHREVLTNGEQTLTVREFFY